MIKRIRSKRVACWVLVLLLVCFSTSIVSYSSTIQRFGSSWKTVYSSSRGFNRNVSITCYNTSTHKNDIRMLGSNGQTVWTENGAIDYSGSRTFWCGSDVYKIQLRNTGSGSNYCIIN